MAPDSIPLNIYPSRRSQIVGLIAEEAPIKIFAEYVDFADVFFPDMTSKLSEHNRVNDHAIKLVDGQHLLYRPIYSLELVELETLKAYIVTNLSNRFIILFMSLVDAPIFFDRKLDRSFWLSIKYKGPNNLTIRNQYLLSLAGELLDWLKSQAISQLDFTNAYHQMRIYKRKDDISDSIWPL